MDAEMADKVAIKAIIIGQNPSEDTGSVISRESKNPTPTVRSPDSCRTSSGSDFPPRLPSPALGPTIELEGVGVTRQDLPHEIDGRPIMEIQGNPRRRVNGGPESESDSTASGDSSRASDSLNGGLGFVGARVINYFRHVVFTYSVWNPRSGSFGIGYAY
jgi:hypothetical protein